MADSQLLGRTEEGRASVTGLGGGVQVEITRMKRGGREREGEKEEGERQREQEVSVRGDGQEHMAREASLENRLMEQK